MTGRRISKYGTVADHPHLAAQFDVAANGGRAPAQVSAGIGEKLWWVCPAGPDHRWQASVVSRVRLGAGCPACAGLRVSVTNSLARHPKLVAEFDVERNGGRTPDQVIANTQEKLCWVCPAGPDHRWQAPGNARVRGSGCPACAGLQVSVTNSLARHPKLVAQFDVERNGCTPEHVVAGTGKKLWWGCPAGPDHRWQATGANRVKGRGCPMCAGKQVSVTNSLARLPELAATFDVDRNGCPPDQVVASTHKKLWWVCPAGPDHRWQASGYARVRGNGCPACAGRQVSVTNSLAGYPELAAEFDVERNGGRTPDQISAGTAERLWWTCRAGPDHRWRAPGYHRVAGVGCPACDGKQLSTTNSLANYHHLAAQFDVEANGGRTPDRIIAGTNKKLWWVCPVSSDHRWAATGNDRLQGRGCPDCGLGHSSAREVRLAAELAAIFPGVAVGHHRIKLPCHGVQHVDILDRPGRLVVEYDGSYWHAGERRERRDRDKTIRLTEAGYTVIRVREAPLARITADDVITGPRTPIHAVTASVLDRIAELRPDLLSAAEAASYRAGGGTVAAEAAEARLRELRTRSLRAERGVRRSVGPSVPPDGEGEERLGLQ